MGFVDQRVSSRAKATRTERTLPECFSEEASCASERVGGSAFAKASARQAGCEAPDQCLKRATGIEPV